MRRSKLKQLFTSLTHRDRSVSVIIPALNEASTIEYVVSLALKNAGVREVIVVDDGSVDDTRDVASRAGARVVTSSLRGKGSSMSDGLAEAAGEIIVYLDGDLRGLAGDLIEKLVRPIQSSDADFVKARFSRSAGRVTTLTAKPLVQTFFPEIAHFTQPLGGIIAVRKKLLERLRFETDYGVDIALLIDAHWAGARIVEVDIGHLEHDSQTLEALGEMAKQVVRALLHRAERYGRLSVQHIQAVEEVERLANADLSQIAWHLGTVEKLAIFDMDGTLVRNRSIVALAERVGRRDRVERYLDNPRMDAVARTEAIARVLAGVPRDTFVEVARDMELVNGARETIVGLRREGYCVGIVSDSFRIFTETIRRRVFADFSVANLLHFRNGAATGEITASPFFQHSHGCTDHETCKWNALLHLQEKLAIGPDQVLAVGDNKNDVCLLRKAGVGIAFEPKTDALRRTAGYVIEGDLRQVLGLCGIGNRSGVVPA